MRITIGMNFAVALSAIIGLSQTAHAEFGDRFWISRGGHDTGAHDVAIPTNGGNAAFVWEEIGTPKQIKGRTLSPTNVLGSIFRLSRQNPEAFQPHVAMNGDGDAHYVWNEGSTGETRTRKLPAAGLLEPTIGVSGLTYPSQIAVNDEGRAVFVGGSLQRAVETRTRFSDGTLGPKLTLFQADEFDEWSNGDTQPQVAVTSFGDAAFCWRRFLGPGPAHSIDARTLSAAGVLGQLHTSLNPDHENVGECRVQMGAAGKAIVVFSSILNFDDLNPTVWARTLSADGVLGPLLRISGLARGSSSYELDTDGAGNAVFVWVKTEADQLTTVVQTRTLSNDGTLGPIQTISSKGARKPDVSVTPDGKAFFAWERFDGEHSRIQARELPVGGPIGPVQNLSRKGSDAHDPQIATDGSARAVAIWSAFDGANWRIRGAVTQ